MSGQTIGLELDGKKLFDDAFEFVPGQLKGLSLQTNDGIKGDNEPSLVMRVEVADEEGATPLTVLVDVKLVILLAALAQTRKRLDYLESIKTMIKVVS